MGKGEQNLPRQQQSHDGGNRGSSGFCCEGCSVVLSRFSKQLSLKCVLVLIFSIAVFLSAIFWILPLHRIRSGFDASSAVKDSAAVQASFRLQRPVSELIPLIEQLEYDLSGELSAPDTKVAILSLHQSIAPNWTDVVFGILSDPLNAPINPVSLSVLKSSLIDLFLQGTNLTLTTSIFGQPYMFEILKFPGGITVIPKQSAYIWQTPEILFNFTINNSILEVEENFFELMDQLKYGLHLKSYENVYVQMTNSYGSTVTSPVTVEASVMSDLGGLVPQRLKQLAQTISDSPRKNLGLDNSVFGKVKSVILSSYLNGTLNPPAPTSSPSPSPEPPVSPKPALSPSYRPAHPPHFHRHPRRRGHAPNPKSVRPPQPCPSSAAFPPQSSPTPSPNPMQPSPAHPSLAPHISPSHEASPGSQPSHDTGNSISAAPDSSSPLPSPSSSAVDLSYREVWLVGFYGVLIFYILCWSY